MERIEGLSIDLALDTTRLSRGLTGLRDQLRTVNSEMRANLSAFDYADRSVSKYETKLNGLNRQLEVQKVITQEARAEYEKMVRQYGEGSVEAEKAARVFNREAANLNNLNRTVNNTREELSRLREEQRVSESGWTRLGQRMESFGSKLTNVGDGIKNIGSTLSAALTTSVLAVAGFTSKIASEFDNVEAEIQAKTGATAEEAGKQGKIVGKVWAAGFGESLDEVKDALISVKQNLQGVGDGKGLENATKKALTLSKITGADLNESLRGVNSLMTNFKMSADEAFDYMVTGAQRGLNKSGELEDNIAEYGQLWAQNGFSAKEMFGILENGLKSGAYNFDKVNDFVKEFGISLTDGRFADNIKKFSSGTQDLFNKFKAGKATTKDVFNSAINDLKGMKNQQDKLTLASNLWSALGEDNAMKVIESLNQTNKAYNNVKGATDKANKAMNNTPAAKLQKAWRGLQKDLKPVGDIFINFATSILPNISNAIKNITKPLQNMSPAMQKTTLVISGIAAAIGPVLVAGGAFVGFLGHAAAGIGKLFPAIARAGGLLKWLRLGLAALTGPVGIVIGIVALLTAGFIALYKNSETFRNGVSNLIGKMKELGGKALEGLKTAVGAVVSFFKDQLAVIKQFWQDNGSVIIQAVKNIGTVVGAIFKGIYEVIKFIMPAVLAVIKMVWGNIKGVISGALNVIMGLVKVFAGLFTGDFKKMWEGIKQVFTGALKLIWNGVQLMFWGKMLKGILSLGKLLVNAFKSSWGGIKNVFSTVIKWIVDFVKNRFTTMKNTVNSITTTVKSIISKIWNGILSFFKTIIKSIYDLIKSRFTTLKNTINSIFTGIRNLAKTIWNAIKDNIYNPIKNAVTNTISRFNSLKSRVSEIFSGIKSKVSGYVSDMVDNVKKMPGKMADGIKRTAGKLKDAMKSVGNKMLSGIGKPVNGVIAGINWVLDKLGVDKKLSKWEVPQYAKGTDGHPGGLAVVGDGTGYNAGAELVTTPDGKNYLSPSKPTLVNLPKGTHVMPAFLTKQLIPHYGWGDDIWSGAKNLGKKAWNATKNGAKKVKDAALDVWEYASNPKKLLDLALDKLGISVPSPKDIIGKIAKGGYTKVKDSAVGFLKKQLDGFLSSVPSAGSGVQRWAGIATRALKMTGQYTAANLKALLYQMDTESSGNPKAINLWDSNAKRGTPSKGLMQVIDPTFRQYAMPGFNKNIWDPMSNILASIRYAVSRYGSLARAYRGVGYASGGLIKSAGLYNLAEGGYPEWVIPTDPARRTDAMKLLALAGKDIGNKRPNQLPNAGSGSNTVFEKLLEATLEQTKVLLQLLNKDSNVYLSGDAIFNHVDARLTKQTDLSLYMRGGKK